MRVRRHKMYVRLQEQKWRISATVPSPPNSPYTDRSYFCCRLGLIFIDPSSVWPARSLKENNSL